MTVEFSTFRSRSVVEAVLVTEENIAELARTLHLPLVSLWSPRAPVDDDSAPERSLWLDAGTTAWPGCYLIRDESKFCGYDATMRLVFEDQYEGQYEAFAVRYMQAACGFDII